MVSPSFLISTCSYLLAYVSWITKCPFLRLLDTRFAFTLIIGVPKMVPVRVEVSGER
jgi:hypothetical protein